MIRGVEGIHVWIVAVLIKDFIAPLYVDEFSSRDLNIGSALEKGIAFTHIRTLPEVEVKDKVQTWTVTVN
jgi:hypothetical protein